ncbi:MAG: sugar ABC transporter permease [Chloroflexaceae bacterium]|jgi:arabinogalactan oligomer/maltooligosaccharide transport system permease protein|nr:sugar ABC transporter permease [Chloroflexaceae bacterium]
MGVQTRTTPMKGTRPTRSGARQNWLPYLYVGPALLVMAIITFYPLFYQVYLSFLNLRAINLIAGPQWVGLANYQQILGSLTSEFYVVTGRTIIWTVINVFFHITLGIFLAIQLNKRGLRGARIYRTLLILPWAVPTIVTGLMWRTTLYDYNFGAFNQMLRTVGMQPISWLQDPTNAFIAVVLFNVWAGIPFMMMVAAGALQSVPEELYEVAMVDGANGWQRHWHVTLPLIRPAMIPATILGIIWTFNNFLAIYLITGGGPAGQTDILLTYIYRVAFLGNQFLYSAASAVAVIVFFILVGFVLLNVRITNAMQEADR